MSRDTALGLDFPAVNFYDGQGFMVKKKLGVTSAKQLDGASVCTQQGTTTELNLADYFRANKMKYEVVAFASADETFKAYDAGAATPSPPTPRGSTPSACAPRPPTNIVLPEIISKEPLAPAVRQGDAQWADIVRWTHYAMLNAEEAGITQANVDQMAKSTDNPDIKRILGTEGKYGADLGLTNDWAYRIIKLVGNYGEVFERNVGQGSPLKIQRGLNALWSKGGLQYGPPIR